MLVLIGLVIIAWLAIQTTPVQNWLVRQVTNNLSKNLHATVRVKHVDFSLFNKMLLEGTLVEDLKKDTLLYAGTVKLNITDWFFLKDKIELKYIGLEDAQIMLHRSDSVWNYRFLVDYFSSPQKQSTAPKKVEVDLKELELDNIKLVQRDDWRGETLSFHIGALNVDADTLSFSQKKIRLNTIVLDKPVFGVYNYTGNRPDSLRPKYSDVPIINDPAHLRWNPAGWDIVVNEVKLKDGSISSDKTTDPTLNKHFDGQHVLFTGINGTFKNVVFLKDSLTATINLSTKERSGFVVKSLQANMKMHPEAMEFANLDIKTNRSHLVNYFAMKYETFDDMGSFVSKVYMVGDFTNAEINSDDIAYFAPALQNWKKKIRITGKIQGTVDNLGARKITVQAGNDTYLYGNVKLNGLPDLDKTYIDFEANDFRTTYNDAVTLIPALRRIQQPRLDNLQFIKFKGNFAGFMKDFVTYGTIETNLGTIKSDINMKFPDGGLAGYSGSLKTIDFDLGRFTDMPQIGKINFSGNINGRGIKAANIAAELDGTISSLEANRYTYHDITVKGTIAKRLFNGELLINDSNLVAHMNGLVDLSKKVPEFNFYTDITRADLKNLQLVKDSITVDGKFRMNFSGSTIDNFLGTARIYEASVYKKGRRISFDSLSVESKSLGDNKVITVLSNEFDAALVGEFSVRDLPAAFGAFLNKYYPSYIRPARVPLKNENFSFVITTKKVDEYLDFVDKNLNGFNYSTVTGRINSNENLLDLNAEVPQFSYNNIFFYNTVLKGTGTMDTLSMQSTIADIYVNDSLHFPGTDITMKSANDLSLVGIKTGSNQALNSANLFARVQTMRSGVRITFNESHFDLNGKNWTVDKDGELILSKELVSADGVKFYNGQQEILVTTHPSDIGNTNDIKVEMKKVNIGDFTPYVVTKNRLEGLLTATADIIDPFGKIQVDLSGQAEQFRLDNDSIGKLDLNANYNQRTGKINFASTSQNEHYIFDLKGIYNLEDTAKNELDIMGDFKDTRINLLDKYLSGVFSNITGQTTGQLRIVGPANKLKYLGKMELTDGEFRVNYTNVLYKIPHAVFDFREDEINFGAFTIKDEFNNTGTVTKGVLKHQAFDNLKFDFALNSNKLLVLSTNNTGKESFYGTVYAHVNATLTGPMEDMRLDVKGEPADSSKLYIRSGPVRESGQADFIVWKVYGKEMTPVRIFKESNLRVSLDIAANNYADMYVILDELTGDIIKANGHGNLRIRASTDGEFTITGRYDIDRGNYNFNFQSFLRKPFDLRGTGNYIQWTGDPYDANIKIEAEYKADNVRFSDLALEDVFYKNENIRKYRGEVIVVAKLEKKLMQPDISFQIELPQGNAMKNDPDALQILQRIQSDQNELNKQVAFLIVFNSFGPVSTSASQGGLINTAFEGVVVNSISGVLSGALSKQFSNIFQKIFNDKSIKVNFNAQLYSGSNLINNIDRNRLNIDRTNVNINIGKSFLNERLTFTFGSALDFGLSSQQVQATKNLQFLPDITAEWKVRQDGKVVLTFFYRDSYNYLSGTGARQNRSGASISYRRDFDNIGELLRGNKKKKKNPVPPPVTDTSKSEGSN